MPSKRRLSREEKGKDVTTSLSPVSGSPLDEFDLIHRDALRDTENMSLSQSLLVADFHRQTHEESATCCVIRGLSRGGTCSVFAPLTRL